MLPIFYAIDVILPGKEFPNSLSGKQLQSDVPDIPGMFENKRPKRWGFKLH
jgi:hypothetical protein